MIAVCGFAARKVSSPGQTRLIWLSGNVRILYEPIDFLTKKKMVRPEGYQQVRANSDTGGVEAFSAGSTAVGESLVILYCLTLA